MKVKRSLIALIAVFALSLVCAFCALNFAKKDIALAAEYTIDAPTGNDNVVSVASDSFVLNQSASVRISGKALKFTATVTKDWHDNARLGAVEIVYFATMNKVENGQVVGEIVSKPFGVQPYFEEGKDVHELNVYLNFDKADAAFLDAALDTEFEVAVYARVTTGEGTTFFKAKNGNDVERSMRAVANSVYLNYTEGLGYTKEEVLGLGYFTDGFRTEDDYAVVGTDNVLYVNVPGAPGQLTGVYLDDVRLTATYDQTTDKYTVANFNAEGGKYITIFDEEGKAYSTTFDTGYTLISILDELKSTFGGGGAFSVSVVLYNCADLSGKYALVSDITVGTWTNVNNALSGVFNGLGYALTGYSNSVGNGQVGLFRYSVGATVKNLTMAHVASSAVSTNGAMLFGWVHSAATEDTIIDNVILYSHSHATNSATLANVFQHKAIVTDSIFINSINSSKDYLGGALVYNNNANIEATNTYVVLGDYGRVALSSNRVSGVKTFTGVSEMLNADASGEITITDEQWAELNKIRAYIPLNSSNVSQLASATDGIFVLTEDIDMYSTCVTNDAVSWKAPLIAGVIDGNGYAFTNVYTQAATGGAFIKPANGSWLSFRNVGVEIVKMNGNHSGLFGMLNYGSGEVVNCAVEIENGAGYGSLLGYAIQKSAYVKDTFFYSGSASANSAGIIGNGGSSTVAPVVSNTYVVNYSGATLMMNNNGSTAFNLGTNGVDYFLYQNDAGAFLDDKNVNLSDSVINNIEKIGAIVELNEQSLERASTASGGYWYLADDLDVTGNGPIFTLDKKIVGANRGANVQIDGRGFTLSGISAVTANKGALISNAHGMVSVKNLAIKGTFSGAGSAANVLVGLYRLNSNNKLTVSNVFMNIENYSTTNGGLFASWSPSGTIILDKIFVNIKSSASTSPNLFTGNSWQGTVQCGDVYIVVPTNGYTLDIKGNTYKDADGNVITPGGTGEFDSACIITDSLESMKAHNEGKTWAHITNDLTTLAQLDTEFFGVECTHAVTKWVVDQEATCTAVGQKSLKCTYCDAVLEVQEIEMAAHELGEWEVTEQPTCSAVGAQQQKCTVCDTVVNTGVVEKLPHPEETSEWQTITAPTCVAEGERQKVCGVCGEVIETMAIEKLAHTEGEWETEAEPTCAENGSRVKKCTECGETLASESIPATGDHQEGEWEEEISATCVAEGAMVKKCTACGTELARETIEPTGTHNLTDWIVTVEVTTITDGERIKKCKDCDIVVITEVIEKLGNGVDFDVNDFFTPPHAHVAGEWEVLTEASCGVDGINVKRCTECGKVLERETVAHTGTHVVGEWEILIDSTCLDQGVRVKYCTECGDMLVYGNIAIGDHNASDWLVEKPASCGEDGVRYKECTVCGIELARETVSATGGHTESGVWETSVSATCATTGKEIQRCAVCDIVLEERDTTVVDTHVVGNWETDPLTGTAVRRCVDCGEIIESDTFENVEGVTPIALTADNIDLLLTETEGYFYLTEDIDMTEACANAGWTSNTIFTGTLDGRGHKLYNFTPSGGNYQGLFYKLSGDAKIIDLSMHFTQSPVRGGIAGQVVGGANTSVLFERVAVSYEQFTGHASGFVNVIQGEVLVKDSFVYIGGGSSIGTYSGCFFGGEATTFEPRVQNSYAVSLNSRVNYPMTSYAGSGSGENRIFVDLYNANFNVAAADVDYFIFTSVDSFNGAIAQNKINLPAIVTEQMINLGVIEEHEHVIGDWAEYSKATCQDHGVEAKHCTICGLAMETRVTAKASHQAAEWYVLTPATCSANGVMVRRCTCCALDLAQKEIAIDQNNHADVEWVMNGNTMTGTCNACGQGVGSHTVAAPEYHNTETETFSIWAYGATPGKYISWRETAGGPNIKAWLFEKGDGSVQYIEEADFAYYYYDANGNLVNSATAVDNHITSADAVNMTTTTENGTLDVYKAANFNTLNLTFGFDVDYDNLEGTAAGEVLQWAADNGIDVIVQGSNFHSLAGRTTSLIDPVNGIDYTPGARLPANVTFKTQQDLNEFAVYHLRNFLTNETYKQVFKGVTLHDEPSWEMFVAMGQVTKALLYASEYYGIEFYAMANLVPYAHSVGHWELFNGEGLTGYAAYEAYLEAYYENVGQYLGYVQYDDYPLRVEGYKSAANNTEMYYEEIIQYYLRTHQFTSEWAREKGIYRAMAVQSYGDTDKDENGNPVNYPVGKRGCSEEDILWQMNLSAAFGVKDFTYYTYFPIINTWKDVDRGGDEYIVNRYGEKNPAYDGVQQVNGELLDKGKALMNFEYEDLHYFTNGNPDDYFFAGCGGTACTECALVQGDLRFVTGATLAFDGALLITELVDEQNGVYGYYIVNMTDPLDNCSGNVTVSISELFNSVQIYHGELITNQALTNGQLTINLGVGDGAFIIPYNA